MAKDNEVLSILFGVRGGGDIRGESGKLIKSQLESIARDIRLKVNLDKEHFKKQVEELLGKKLDIKVAPAANENIKTSSSNNVSKTYRETERALKATYKEEEKLLALRHKNSDVLTEQFNILSKASQKLASLGSFDATGSFETKHDNLTDIEIAKINELNSKLEDQLNLKKAIAKSQDIDKSHSQQLSYYGVQANASSLIDRYKDLGRYSKEASKVLERLADLTRKPISDNYEELERAIQELKRETKLANSELAQMSTEQDTFGRRLRKAFDSKFLNTLSYALMGLATRAFRQVYNNVVELNTEMTQLRIVARASEKEFTRFSDSIVKSARRIGSSVTDLIKSTVVFARLGYSIKEAQILAELTTVYSRVAAVNINEATDNITAAIKAFGIQADGLEAVLDQFVWVGNTFAISSEQIGRAMNNAASSLAANGNTLQEAIGILTAANTTVQNENISSTAVRTMAARIGRSSAELMELGEDIGNVMSTARLDAKMREFGVAIVDTNGKLRSTYDILADLASMWHTIEGTTHQAAIAEMIAGTRIQNVFYSVMQNWHDAEAIVRRQAEGVGSLQAAQGEYINSIAGKMAQLNASWQDFSQNLLSSEFVKVFVDILKVIASVLNSVASFGNGLAVWTVIAAGAVVGGQKLIAALIELVKLKVIDVQATQKQILAEQKRAIASGQAISVEKARELAILRTRNAMIRSIATMAALVLVLMAISTENKKTAKTLSIVSFAVSAFAAAFAIAMFKVKAALTSTGIGALIVAIGSALAGIISLAKRFKAPSLADLKETAKEAKEALRDLRSEIEEVNNELETTQERIDELMKKDNLTFVEKDELDNLRLINAELKQRLAILDEEEKKAQRNASEAASDVVNKLIYGGADSKGDKTKKLLASIFSFGLSDSIGGYGVQSIDRITNAQDMEYILENWQKASQSQKDFVTDINKQVLEQIDLLDPLSDTYKEAIKWIDKFTIAAKSDGKSLVWDAMLSRETNKEATEALKKLAYEGVVTKERLTELYKNNSGVKSLIDGFEALGITISGADGFLESFVKQIDSLFESDVPGVALLSLEEAISDSTNGFGSLSKALEEVANNGSLSAETVKELLEAYSGLDKYFSLSSAENSDGFITSVGGYGISPEYQQYDKTSDIMRLYASDQIEPFIARLKEAKEKEDELIAAKARDELLAEAKQAVANAQKNVNVNIEAYALLIRSQVIKEETDRLNAQKDALKSQEDAYKNLIDIRKDLLKTYKKELDYQKELVKKQQSVADLQTQLALARMDTSATGQSRARELESQLQTAQEELDEFTLEHAIEVLTQQLDNEFSEYQKLIVSQTDRIVEEIANLAKSFAVEMGDVLDKANEQADARIVRQKNYDEAVVQHEQDTKNTITERDAAEKALADAKKALEDAEAMGTTSKKWSWDITKGGWVGMHEYTDQNKVKERNDAIKAANDAIKAADEAIIGVYNRLNDLEKNIPVYHTGGIVGASNLAGSKTNEVFAKLMRGEVVVTPKQMSSFMGKTLPDILSSGKGVNNYTIQLNAESITKESVSDVEDILNKALNRMKHEFGAGISRAGQKNFTGRFTQS